MSRFEFTEDYLISLRRRDPDIWEHFDRTFRPRVRAKFRMKFRPELVDDLTNETMLAILVRVDEGEPRDAACLPSYVFSICQNKTREEWRRRDKENAADVDLALLRGVGPTPQEETIGSEEAQKIQKTLARLNARDREVLIEVFYHGTSRDEICARYGVDREQLKMILFHARKRFQREWKRD